MIRQIWSGNLSFGLKSFLKTSRATGLHLFVPVKPVYSFKLVRSLAHFIERIANRENSKLATTENIVKNGEAEHIDYLKNIEGKTLASVYSR